MNSPRYKGSFKTFFSGTWMLFRYQTGKKTRKISSLLIFNTSSCVLFWKHTKQSLTLFDFQRHITPSDFHTFPTSCPLTFCLSCCSRTFSGEGSFLSSIYMAMQQRTSILSSVGLVILLMTKQSSCLLSSLHPCHESVTWHPSHKPEILLNKKTLLRNLLHHMNVTPQGKELNIRKSPWKK